MQRLRIKYYKNNIFTMKRSAITNFYDSANSTKPHENLVGGLFVKCELMLKVITEKPLSLLFQFNFLKKEFI